MSDATGAEHDARRAIEAWSALPNLRGTAHAVLSRALLAQGRTQEALAAAIEAMALFGACERIEEGDAYMRLAHVEALVAAGAREEASAALSSAHAQLIAHAARIREPSWCQSFLECVPENARTIAVAREWGLIRA